MAEQPHADRCFLDCLLASVIQDDVCAEVDDGTEAQQARYDQVTRWSDQAFERLRWIDAASAWRCLTLAVAVQEEHRG